jgi:hypothetical protein
VVSAPGKIERPAQDKIKTDQRLALTLDAMNGPAAPVGPGRKP